jgi:hypothetical protein
MTAARAVVPVAKARSEGEVTPSRPDPHAQRAVRLVSRVGGASAVRRRRSRVRRWGGVEPAHAGRVRPVLGTMPQVRIMIPPKGMVQLWAWIQNSDDRSWLVCIGWTAPQRAARPLHRLRRPRRHPQEHDSDLWRATPRGLPDVTLRDSRTRPGRGMSVLMAAERRPGPI